MIKASSWASSAALSLALAITFTCADAEATPVPNGGKSRPLTAGTEAVVPTVAMGGATLARQVARSAPRLQARYSRSEFMEDTPREIAMENRANPWQAWALAFFPTAIVKGVTLGLAFAKADQDQWAVFLPMIPSMGLSHFWETKFYWAGLIALAGDITGSALVTMYWADVYKAPTLAMRPEKTMLWAGIGVLAVFWVYEMVTAALFANWRNAKLREQFMPAEKKTAVGPNWRSSPYPNTGIAQIGPPVRSPIPISAAYTFSF
jgi:hypothetical protein